MGAVMTTTMTVYSIFPATRETLRALLDAKHEFYIAGDDLTGNEVAIYLTEDDDEVRALGRRVDEDLRRRGARDVRISYRGAR